MRKIVKTTTVGSLKNKLNESKGNFALGQGFGSEPRFKSNVQDNSDYSRKLDKNGGFGLGDGFTKLNEEEMVDFIANIVESMKGKTEYHNLKFVDRIGNENGLFESQIKNIKNIIKSDRTPYQLKLRKYLTENVAKEMSGIYEGYSGLMHEGEMMVNEIKSTFNEMKSMGKSTNEAVAMTAEALDVPMEMVGKMVQVQKEAYKARMEGMGETMDINEKLCEVYESYKNMAEGNMKPVYEELKEMMNPEPIEPEENEESEYGEYGDFGTEEEYGEYLRGSEGGDYDDDDTDYQISRGKEDGYYLEEDLCMECDDMDDESYIEVELSSPKDFALLPMLAKGAMSAGRMPSMGMGKMSRTMNSPVKDYEVPMDYSTSNPYSQYRYDTGLGKIPYGKKKFMSDERDEESFERDKFMYENVLRKNLSIKISSCNRYMMIENRIFSMETGEEIKNKLIAESLLIEGWNALDYIQSFVSIASIFIPPPASNAALFVNAVVAFIRAYMTAEGDDMKYERYLNSFLDIASAVIPTVFGALSAGFRAAWGVVKTATATSKSLGLVKTVLTSIIKYGSKIINDGLVKFLNWKAVRWILGGKFCDGLIKSIRGIYQGIVNLLTKGVTKASTTAAKVTTKVAKLVGKKGFETFFKSVKGVVKIGANKGTELLTKLGYKVGQTVTIKGQKFIIKSISAKQGKIIITNAKGISGQIPLDDFINTALKSNAFKTYANMVFKSPATYAQAYKFLGGFGFDDDGSMTKVDTSGIGLDVANQIAEESLNLEIAPYEGESGSYNVNDKVTAVQNALQSLGENLGGAGVDGKYGPITKAAINNVEGKVGAPLTASSITPKTVAAIVIALLQEDKLEDAKALANANIVEDANILEKLNALLDTIAISNQAKADALKSFMKFGGTSTASSDNSWEKTMSSLKSSFYPMSTVSENTFSESYKRMFGLTLD